MLDDPTGKTLPKLSDACFETFFGRQPIRLVFQTQLHESQQFDRVTFRAVLAQDGVMPMQFSRNYF